MIRKIDHIGIAVSSIEKQRLFYDKILGLEYRGEEVVPEQKVRIAFFSAGDTLIELLEPTSADSPIAKFIASRGEGFHHIAYETDDLEGLLRMAASDGRRLIHDNPVRGGGGKEIAFLHPGSTGGVLTEFCAREEWNKGSS